MKKEYSTPEIEIIIMEPTDIICDSGDDFNDSNNGNSVNHDDPNFT